MKTITISRDGQTLRVIKPAKEFVGFTRDAKGFNPSLGYCPVEVRNLCEKLEPTMTAYTVQ